MCKQGVMSKSKLAKYPHYLPCCIVCQPEKEHSLPMMRPSALLSYITTRAFLRTEEKCIEKQPSASRTYGVFLKIPIKCLYNSTMHEEKFFISLIKC